jgi:hypothetical protein
MKPEQNLRRKSLGGILAMIGYLLSPLSWWNDLFINVPLALAFAWIVSAFYPPAFEASFVIGYWLTNVAGFILLHKGASVMLSRKAKGYDRRQLAIDFVISLLYTLLILILVRLRIVAPLPEYFHKR